MHVLLHFFDKRYSISIGSAYTESAAWDVHTALCFFVYE